jgi:hypothetical protein
VSRRALFVEVALAVIVILASAFTINRYARSKSQPQQPTVKFLVFLMQEADGQAQVVQVHATDPRRAAATAYHQYKHMTVFEVWLYVELTDGRSGWLPVARKDWLPNMTAKFRCGFLEAGSKSPRFDWETQRVDAEKYVLYGTP